MKFPCNHAIQKNTASRRERRAFPERTPRQVVSQRTSPLLPPWGSPQLRWGQYAASGIFARHLPRPRPQGRSHTTSLRCMRAGAEGSSRRQCPALSPTEGDATQPAARALALGAGEPPPTPQSPTRILRILARPHIVWPGPLTLGVFRGWNPLNRRRHNPHHGAAGDLLFSRILRILASPHAVWPGLRPTKKKREPKPPPLQQKTYAFSFAYTTALYTSAATAPPMSGATMNTHT